MSKISESLCTTNNRVEADWIMRPAVGPGGVLFYRMRDGKYFWGNGHSEITKGQVYTTDSFDATAPLKAYFDFTYKCNLQCRHCLTDSSPFADTSTELSTPRILELVSEIASIGILEIATAGGEPLTHPDWEEIFRHITSQGVNLVVTTNKSARPTEVTEKWIRQNRDVVLDTPWLKVYKDRYRLPNNHFIPDYYIWEGSDAALCICRIEDQALLVRQYRPGVEKPTLCHPGGRLDPTDPSPLAGAVRELLEETGYSPQSTVPLGSFGQIPAISPNRVHIFLVSCEEKPIDRPKPDKSENIDTKLVPLTDLPDLMSSGEMDCVACVAASYLALYHLNLK